MNKKILKTKKDLKRQMRSRNISYNRLQQAYKTAWLNEYKTAIYNHGFHPAWGEPLTVTHHAYGEKRTEVITPYYIDGDNKQFLPFKEYKAVERMVGILYSGDQLRVNNE